MRRTLHLALHDTRLFLTARENIFFMFLMPVMFMLFFSVVLRGGGSGPAQARIALQVVNQDDGFLSEAFLDQLQSEQFDLQRLDVAAADTTDYIRRLVIPSDFTAEVEAGRPIELQLAKDADGSIEYDAAAEVRLHQAQVSFLGALIRWAHPAGTPVSAEDQARLQAVMSEARQITVSVSHAGRGRPVPRGAGQSIPGMLTMFVVMIVAIGGSESLTREKQQGTLARLAVTTISQGEIIAGKLLHLGLVGFVQACVLLAAGEAIGRFHLFNIDFSWGPNWWVVVLFTLPYAFTVAGLTLLMGGLFRTTQQAESLAWLVGMVFSAMGGCWWPAEIMPRGAQIAAHLFPTYWSMQALHGVVTFGRGLDAIALPTVVLLGMGLLLAWLGARTMRVVR